MSDNVYGVLELAIKPGELDNFKRLMTEMVEATQTNEPNTLHSVLCLCHQLQALPAKFIYSKQVE